MQSEKSLSPIGGICSWSKGQATDVCNAPFTGLKDKNEMLDWMTYTVPSIFWPTGDALKLGTYNTLLGYLNVRVKHVKPANGTEHCGMSKSFVDSITHPSATCLPREVVSENERTDAFENISEYWQRVTTDPGPESEIRGTLNPGYFNSTEVNQKKQIGHVRGEISDYDAAGFSVDYRMELASGDGVGVGAYRTDLAMLRDGGWFGSTARAVILEFNSYNLHYDLWANTRLLMELQGDGVHPTYTIRTFLPRVYETEAELAVTYLDYVRLCIGIYILVFVGWFERQHKIRNHKAGFYYHITLTGITDVGMVTCMLITTLWRAVGFQSEPTSVYLEASSDLESGYTSFYDTAWSFNSIFVVDGLMMVFVMFRMISFFRLHHKVYLLWHALGEALKAFCLFLLVFFPMLVSLVIVATRVFGAHMWNFRSLDSTFIGIFLMLSGETTDASERDGVWVLAATLMLYIVVTVTLGSVFMAILVDAHYVVQLTSAQPSEKWDAQRLRSWALPGPCVGIYQAIFAPRTSDGRE